MKVTDEQLYSLLRQFLTVYLPKQKCYSKNTIHSYRIAYNLQIDFLRDIKGIAIESIGFHVLSRAVVIEYLDWLEVERKCCASTRNQRLFSLISFFQYAASENPELIPNLLDLHKIPVKKSKSGRVEK